MAGAFAPNIEGPGSEDPIAFLERLYGPVTARSRAGLMPETASLTALDEDPRITELREPGAAEGAFGVMGDIAMQPIRAGEAVGEALSDPTLANVSNAGVQTALTLGKPYAAAGSAGLGLLEGLRRDLGATLDSPAYAAKKAKKSSFVPDPYDPTSGINESMHNELQRLRQKEEEGVLSRAEREKQNSIMSIIAAAQSAKAEAQAKAGLEADKKRIEEEAAQKASKRQEYDRQVQTAESMRDKERARIKRFADTEFGKVYDKTGGALPFLAAAGGGALHRAASGGASGFLNKVALPAIEGTGLALTANSIPLAYDAFLTPPDNPEKEAMTAYARELPPEHPRKEEMGAFAEKLPSRNPVREAASEEFYNEFGPRLGISAMEGIPAALTGANIDRIRGRIMGQKAPDLNPKPTGPKPQGRVSRWLDGLFGKADAPAATPAVSGPAPQGGPQGQLPPPFESQAAGGAVKPKAKSKYKGPKADWNWNEKSQRWHDANGDFVKGGKPPK